MTDDANGRSSWTPESLPLAPIPSEPDQGQAEIDQKNQLWLQQALRDQGVEVLAVLADDRDHALLRVFLHGEAGQWTSDANAFCADTRVGLALRAVRAVPGVVRAEESEDSQTIILAWIA